MKTALVFPACQKEYFRKLRISLGRIGFTCEEFSTKGDVLDLMADGEEFDVVITYLHIAANGDTPYSENQSGLDLVRRIRFLYRDNPIKCVIIVSTQNNEVAGEAVKQSYSALVLEPVESMANLIQRTLTGQLSKKTITVKIDLHGPLDGVERARYSITSDASEKSGEMALNKSYVGLLLDVSMTLRIARTRENVMRYGEGLWEWLIRSQTSFQDQLNETLKSFGYRDIGMPALFAGNEASAQIISDSVGWRFLIRSVRERFGILFEGIGLPYDGGYVPLVNHAPLVRVFDNGRKEALPRARKCRCLIIDATASGVAMLPNESMQVELPPMGNVTNECNDVAEMLRGMSGDGVHFEVHTVNKGWAQTEEKLLEGDWDIVHFAGHSMYLKSGSKSVGAGYMFFPGKPGEPEAVGHDKFLGLLKECELFYLSACVSANPELAYFLSTQDVKNVIAFHFKLDDADGLRFAKDFYEESLKVRFLDFENAIYESKRKCWQRQRNSEKPDWTWMSATLLSSSDQLEFS